MLAEDGSGKGAGLVSAIAQRITARLACTANGHSSKIMNGHGKEMNGLETHTNGYHNGITNGPDGAANDHCAADGFEWTRKKEDDVEILTAQ